MKLPTTSTTTTTTTTTGSETTTTTTSTATSTTTTTTLYTVVTATTANTKDNSTLQDIPKARRRTSVNSTDYQYYDYSHFDYINELMNETFLKTVEEVGDEYYNYTDEYEEGYDLDQMTNEISSSTDYAVDSQEKGDEESSKHTPRFDIEKSDNSESEKSAKLDTEKSTSSDKSSNYGDNENISDKDGVLTAEILFSVPRDENGEPPVTTPPTPHHKKENKKAERDKNRENETFIKNSPLRVHNSGTVLGHSTLTVFITFYLSIQLYWL